MKKLKETINVKELINEVYESLLKTHSTEPNSPMNGKEALKYEIQKSICDVLYDKYNLKGILLRKEAEKVKSLHPDCFETSSFIIPNDFPYNMEEIISSLKCIAGAFINGDINCVNSDFSKKMANELNISAIILRSASILSYLFMEEYDEK